MATPLRPLFVVNPAAAGGLSERQLTDLHALFLRYFPHAHVRKSDDGNHASAIAKAASSEGFDAVVAVGGDGMIHHVAQGLIGTKNAPALGMFVVGTGGDLRRSFGIEHRPDRYLEAIKSGQVRAIDTLHVSFEHQGTKTERHVLNVASVGMGGWVDSYVRTAPRMLGASAAYYLASLQGLLKTPLLELEVRVDGTLHQVQTRMLALCNGRYFGAGMHIAPDASLDDGVVDLVALTQRTRLGFVRNSSSIYDGSHIGRATTWHTRGKHIEVWIKPSQMYAARLDLDGEPLGHAPLTLKTAPKSLLVFDNGTT